MSHEVSQIADMLAGFFKNEPRKITLWLLTSNSYMGGTIPAEFILMRPQKALMIIKDMAEGETP